jgi:hypothetical protein
MSEANSMGRDMRKELLGGNKGKRQRTEEEQAAAVDEMAQRFEQGLDLFTGLPLTGAKRQAWVKLKEEEERQKRKPPRKPRAVPAPAVTLPVENLPMVLPNINVCGLCGSNLCSHNCPGCYI